MGIARRDDLFEVGFGSVPCSYPPRQACALDAGPSRRKTPSVDGCFCGPSRDRTLRRGGETPALPPSLWALERAKSRSHEFLKRRRADIERSDDMGPREAQIRRIAMSASCGPARRTPMYALLVLEPPGAASDLGLVECFFIWDCDARFPDSASKFEFLGCVLWDACRCAPSLFATSSVRGGKGWASARFVLSRDAAEKVPAQGGCAETDDPKGNNGARGDQVPIEVRVMVSGEAFDVAAVPGEQRLQWTS